MSDLKHELEDFINHPGWRWFTERVDREWGANGSRFTAELKTALNLTDNNAAASQARQILSGQAVILAMLRAPHEELAKLKGLESARVGGIDHGRPALAEELVGQSRRGGL